MVPRPKILPTTRPSLEATGRLQGEDLARPFDVEHFVGYQPRRDGCGEAGLKLRESPPANRTLSMVESILGKFAVRMS